MLAPYSLHSSSDIHISLNRDKLANMLAPQNTLWPRSLGALTLIFMVGGARRRTCANCYNGTRRGKGGKNICGYILFEALLKAGIQRGAPADYNVVVEILRGVRACRQEDIYLMTHLANVNVTLVYRIVHQLANALLLHAEQRRLEQRFGASESLRADRNDLQALL
jgi:hypothetical protein